MLIDVDDLTAPERALWGAFPRGELVDLRTDDAARTIRPAARSEAPTGRYAPRWLLATALIAGVTRVLRKE